MMSAAIPAISDRHAVTVPATSCEARLAVNRHLALAALLSLLLVCGVGSWATFTEIDGAVIAPGQLVVESEVKKVQHPSGGVIGAIFVREGDHVKSGDVLVRLDETQTRANLDITLKAIDELDAQQARQEAERDGASSVAFSTDLLLRQHTDRNVARIVEGENKLFYARRAGRDGQRAQLLERIRQLRQEIGGLNRQTAAKDREVVLITEELKGVHDLYSKNLVPLSRVTALERDAARLQGDGGQLTASSASAKGKIAEIELQMLQIDADMRTEVGKELSAIRAKRSELVEKRVAAEDQLKRVAMRAPQDGVVHQMTVHTVGGLVVPSEPAMLIVPENDQLVVELRVQPQDINNVRAGQLAILRFAAFNSRTTPEINASIARVSADVSVDPKSGQSYYTARLAILPEQRSKLGTLQLVPGMPVEAHLQTGERTVISYLTKPLVDQFSKAWKEI